MYSRDLKRIAVATAALRERVPGAGPADSASTERALVLGEAAAYRSLLRAIKRSVHLQYVEIFTRWYGCIPTGGRPYPLHYQTIASQWMRLGGYALPAMKTLLPLWLPGIAKPQSSWIVALCAAVVGVLLGIAAKGVKALLLAVYADAPSTACRVLTRWGAAVSAVEASLLLIFLVVNPSLGLLSLGAVHLRGIASALFVLTTISLSATLLACAELYGFSSVFAAAWHRADMLDRELAAIERITRLERQ